MKSHVQFLDHSRRTIVLDAIKQHAGYRGWPLHAAHVRSTHVHVIIQAPVPPEKVLVELKAYASRALNESENAAPHRWAHHGSTKYLWDGDQFEAAMDYVVRKQGGLIGANWDSRRGCLWGRPSVHFNGLPNSGLNPPPMRACPKPSVALVQELAPHLL